MKPKSRTILALTAMIFMAVMLWYNNQAANPKNATWGDVSGEARAGRYQLISTDELQERYLSKPDTILLVDTRQEWEYRSGHIKGAINFPIEPTWLSRWRKRGALEQLLGPDKNRLIVFY